MVERWLRGNMSVEKLYYKSCTKVKQKSNKSTDQLELERIPSRDLRQPAGCDHLGVRTNTSMLPPCWFL